MLNKIDLPAANPERVAKELEHLIGIDREDIIAVSGKTGQNVELVLDAIIERIEDPLSFFAKHSKKFRSDTIIQTSVTSNAVRSIGNSEPNNSNTSPSSASSK